MLKLCLQALRCPVVLQTWYPVIVRNKDWLLSSTSGPKQVVLTLLVYSYWPIIFSESLLFSWLSTHPSSSSWRLTWKPFDWMTLYRPIGTKCHLLLLHQKMDEHLMRIASTRSSPYTATAMHCEEQCPLVLQSSHTHNNKTFHCSPFHCVEGGAASARKLTTISALKHQLGITISQQTGKPGWKPNPVFHTKNRILLTYNYSL